MTSMRIDENASAELWAKRLGKLFDEMESDGVELLVDGNTICICKDGEESSTWVKE